MLSNLTEAFSCKSHYNNIMDTNKILQNEFMKWISPLGKNDYPSIDEIPCEIKGMKLRMNGEKGGDSNEDEDIQRRQFADGKNMYEIIFGWVDEGYGWKPDGTFKKFLRGKKPNERALKELIWDIQKKYIVFA